jgi:hypothetical protein
MELEGLSRADLARRFGCSRARVTQKLNLLSLPRELLREIVALGDHWDRRLVTERKLREAVLWNIDCKNCSHDLTRYNPKDILPSSNK